MQNREDINADQRFISMSVEEVSDLLDRKVVVGVSPSVERHAMIAMAFSKLSPRQQECLLMHLREQKHTGLIAKESGIDRSSVRVHISRGLKMLLASIDDQASQSGELGSLIFDNVPLIYRGTAI